MKTHYWNVFYQFETKYYGKNNDIKQLIVSDEFFTEQSHMLFSEEEAAENVADYDLPYAYTLKVSEDSVERIDLSDAIHDIERRRAE